MIAIEFELPGGLPRGDRLHRRVRLHALTGRVELAIAEALQHEGLDGVDELLATVIERIGDLDGSLALVRELCIADRKFVVLRVATLLRGSRVRPIERCPSCATPIELDVDLAQLSVTPAGPGYPTCERQMGGRRVRLRVPTGADQRGSASHDEQQARLELLDRCAEPLDGEGDLNARLFDAIERAIETMSPNVATTVLAICRGCRREQSITIDPIAFVRPPRGELDVLGEIHTLAFHYHWSEADILALPRARRHVYLQQIERELAGRPRTSTRDDFGPTLAHSRAAASTITADEVTRERPVTLEIGPDVPRPRNTPSDLLEPAKAAPWVEYASASARR